LFLKNAPSGASLALALIAILSAPLPGRAADRTVLRPLLDVDQGWDSNIFNGSNNDEGSLVTRVSPGIWIENSGEAGNASLGLTAIGRSVWRESELSGIDSNARGDFERRLTPRLSVFGNGALEYYSGYQEILDPSGGPAGSPGELIRAEQPAWKHDQLGAGFRYLLTPRLALRLKGSAGRVNYEVVEPISFTPAGIPIGNQTGYYRDRSLLDAGASLLYQLTPLDQLSLDIDADDTSYQNLGTGSNDTSIWNTQLGWTRDWTPVWSTSASIGVRALDTTQKDVPQRGGSIFGPVTLDSASFSDSGTGLIGSLSIQRTFARSALQLSYSRDTRSTGGATRTNFNIDSFSLSLTHRLAERVKLTLAGDYSLYHSVSDQLPNYAAQVSGSSAFCGAGGTPRIVGFQQIFGFDIPVYQCVGGSSEEKQEYTSLLARVDWQMRRKLNGYLVARYYTSTTDQTLGGGRSIQTGDFDKFTLSVGFRYAWELGL
jgi:hypothetical protein